MGMIRYVRDFFFSDARTSRLSKNIFYSFGIKGYAMVIQFALVPITLNYLDKFQYGIWLVMASILDWFTYFDIGIGHGLRNRLSEALATGEMKLAKIFTSTSYALVTLIFSVIILGFAIANPFLDWSAILNIPAEQAAEMTELMLLVFIFFSLRFILSLISSVIFAYQDPALNYVIGPLGSTISLVAILVFAKYVSGSLYWIAIVFSAAPLLVMVVFTIILFNTRYKAVKPDITHVDFSYSKRLLGLGVGFFIIQVSMLVMYSGANLVLTQLYGPEEVTVYNIGERYFSILVTVGGIVILPYWSSFTEAYYKNDIAWIRSSIRKLTYMTLLMVGGLVISLFLADPVIDLWVGGKVSVPLTLKLALTFNVAVQLLATPYIIFINGVSKIRLQLLVAVVSIFITIPLAILFCKTLNFGTAGVVVAIICSTLPGGILWRIQYQKIVNGKATGIWNS